MPLVQEGHFRSGVEDEHVPAVTVDRAAHRGPELFDEQVLINDRLSRSGEDPREGDVVAAEVELDSKFLQQMRAEEKVDLEFFFAGDQKLHLVIGHDRHRHVGDRHPAQVELVQQSEMHRNGLAEETGEGAFEGTERPHLQ